MTANLYNILETDVSKNIIQITTGTTMTASVNKISGVVVGQYGNPIQFTIVDSNGVAVNISTYTTRQVIISSPFDLKTKTYTATFVTDGTNGQLQFTPTSGDFDRAGKWTGEAKLSTVSIVDYTVPFDIIVSEGLG